MPPRRRSASDALTHEQLAMLTEALQAGRRATVYLREAVPTLGLEAGASARVIAIAGNTVTIRPKGVDDELPYEAEELRLNRTAEAKVITAKVVATKPVSEKPVSTRLSSARLSSAKPVSTKPNPVPAIVNDKPAPVSTVSRRRKTAHNVSITIQSTSPEHWSVTVGIGAKRPGKPIPITAESVLKAVTALGEEAVKEAVAEVVDQAREAAQQRVAELAAQLEQAQVTLKALGSM